MFTDCVNMLCDREIENKTRAALSSGTVDINDLIKVPRCLLPHLTWLQAALSDLVLLLCLETIVSYKALIC